MLSDLAPYLTNPSMIEAEKKKRFLLKKALKPT
jgi:hypothetical protein